MWPAFPASDYYDGSAPSQAAQPTTGLTRHRPGRPAGGADPGWFPRSPHTGRRGRCPAIPLRPRHEYAADLPRGLPAGDFTRPGSRPPSAGVHRTPAHIHQVGAGVSLEGLYTLVPHVHLSVSLAGPGPSGSADPSRRCQGCSHPHRRLPDQAAPSFTGLLRQPGEGSSHLHPVTRASWRTKSSPGVEPDPEDLADAARACRAA